jgi:plasmid stabilization system protein ParE
MEQYSVRHTETSENDLADVIRYIAVDLQEPAIALRMADAIDQAIESLATMSQRCVLVDDERLANLGYRILHIKNYIAFFTLDEEKKTVFVERILYARRDWLHIL